MSVVLEATRRARVLSWVLVLTCAAMASAVRADILPADRAKELQSKGYATDTPEQIMVAAKSESYVDRYRALELLTERIGEEAIPALKDALRDPELAVRWRAAHLLGTLGDRSGLEQMRADLAELAPDNGAPRQVDAADEQEAKAREREEGRRYARLVEALSVARVLAELGDPRGYELAVNMALAAPLTFQRMQAAGTLVEIAKLDGELLRQRGMDPVSVLCAMAESEKEPIVLGAVMGAVKLANEDAVRVLEAVRDSPNAPELQRRIAEGLLRKLQGKRRE